MRIKENNMDTTSLLQYIDSLTGSNQVIVGADWFLDRIVSTDGNGTFTVHGMCGSDSEYTLVEDWMVIHTFTGPETMSLAEARKFAQDYFDGFYDDMELSIRQTESVS
jgi:hypothetical protein